MLKWWLRNQKNLNSIKLICFFIIQGCSTSYQKVGFTGGFSETQLDENIFKVTFQGNGYTHPEKASDLALLRSADITLLKEYSYFIIIDSNYNSNMSTYTTPSTTDTTGILNGSSYRSTSTTYGGNTYSIQKPSSTNTIVMFKKKPSIQRIAYNANFICNSLGNKYHTTCESLQLTDNNKR